MGRREAGKTQRRSCYRAWPKTSHVHDGSRCNGVGGLGVGVDAGNEVTMNHAVLTGSLS